MIDELCAVLNELFFLFGDIVSLGWIILNVIKLLGRAGIHQSSFSVMTTEWSKSFGANLL